MKIALIGPFPPYRGGISMFNHSLSEELSINHDLFKCHSQTISKIFVSRKAKLMK